MQSRLATGLFNIMALALWLVFAAAIPARECGAQNKIIATFTFPEVRIKDFQNAIFPSSVANDHKVLLGSIGSDLWRSFMTVPANFG